RAVRVLGARGLPDRDGRLSRVAARDARLPLPLARLAELAQEETQDDRERGRRDREGRPARQLVLRAPPRARCGRLVELEARGARTRFPVDDRAHLRALAPAFP